MIQPRFALKIAPVLTGVMAGLTMTPAMAQQAPPQDDPGAAPEEIVVQGRTPPGQVKSDVKPEIVLNPADIRAYGVNSVSELLTELAPQTGSIRGRGAGMPVILLNGRRISGFAEVRDLPTEAILRIDILPEETALAYGYRADQRVVNIVLRPRFRSYTVDLDNRTPTAGGTNDSEAEGGYLRIDKSGRFNLNLQYQHQTPLFENERGLVSARSGGVYDVTGNVLPAAGATQIDPALSALAGQPVTIAGVPLSAAGGGATLNDFVPSANIANVTDLTPYRTLRAASDRFSSNAVVNRTVLGNVSATGTLRFELTQSQGFQGLAGTIIDLPSSNPFSPFGTDTRIARYADGYPLVRDGQTWTGNAAITLNGDLSPKWRWSLNTTYDRTQTITQTDRTLNASAFQAAVLAGDPNVDPFGTLLAVGPIGVDRDYARAISSAGGIDGLVAGAPFALPAGDANLSVRVQLNTTDYSSRSIRGSVLQTGDTGRDSATVRTSLSLPIANAAKGVLAPLGNLSISGDAEWNQLSDFGTLWTLGSTLNWTPVKPLRFLVSYTHEQGAPGIQQLGGPVVVTPNVTVFDYVRGASVQVTQISGGNSLLTRDQRNVLKAGVNLKPFKDTDFTVSADYVRSVLSGSATSFPSPTAEIESAFPDRFVRDADGNLVSIDTRPVNFAQNRSQQLRIGFNFSKPIKSNLQKKIDQIRASGGSFADLRQQFIGNRTRPGQSGQGGQGQAGQGTGAPPPPSGDGQASAAPPPGGGPGGPGGGRGFGGFGGGRGNFDARGRLQLSLYYTLELEDTILIRDGVAALDLLNGSAIGSNGGQPRHTVQFQSGYSRDGFGLRLNADYKSATSVNGGTSGGERLNFSDIATVNLRLFADLTARRSLIRKNPWLRGSRVTIGVDNLFDARQRVTDQNGVVPLTYQPGYVDPIGRTVRISFRKLFF